MFYKNEKEILIFVMEVFLKKKEIRVYSIFRLGQNCWKSASRKFWKALFYPSI
jgi:hypothetical protein